MQIKTVLVALLCAAGCIPQADSASAAEMPLYQIASEVRTKIPADVLTLLERADSLAQQGQYDQALPLYRQGTEQYPDMPLFFMRLGEMYFSGTGVKKDAKQAYDWLHQAFGAVGAYDDIYDIKSSNVFYQIRHLRSRAGMEAGEFMMALPPKQQFAMLGDAEAYAELPDDFRRMYAEHIRPLDPSGKTKWHDSTLKGLQERGLPITDERGNRNSSWRTLMESLPDSWLDNQSRAPEYAWRLSLAYQHGIGVPQNRVAAQALRLYAHSTWRIGREAGSPELYFWLLDNLLAVEQAEAERLTAEWLTLSKPSDNMPIDETQSSAVMCSLREYVNQHSKNQNQTMSQ